MLVRASSGSSGSGGGGPINVTPVKVSGPMSGASIVQETATLTGSFTVSSTIASGNTVFKVSRPPSVDRTINNAFSYNNGQLYRTVTVKSNGDVILATGQANMDTGYSWSLNNFTYVI